MGQSLLEVVEKKLQDSDIELPVLHPVALEVQQKMGNEDFEIDEIAEIILKDQALSGQLLKVSNSALFRVGAEITTRFAPAAKCLLAPS